MELGIRNRVAVVAAASRGLGRAVAQALAAEGAKIAICSRDADSLNATAGEIREAHGAEVFAAPVDVTDEPAVKKFLTDVREKLGPVEICVTNAGGPPGGVFADFTSDDWRKAFELNFLSTMYFIRESLIDMRAARWGRVVTITSVSVREPIDGLILSNGVRASVVGLLKTLVREYGGDNILFNNVCPGFTATDRLLSLAKKKADEAGVSRDEIVKGMGSSVPLGRIGEPEEFGSVVAFLCSERASYVNGTSVAVDGGLIRGI